MSNDEAKEYVKSKKFIEVLIKDPNKPPPSPVMLAALAVAGLITTVLILTR